MCGIAGIWMRGGANRALLERRVEGMTAALLHRGPDSAGLFIDESAGLAFGHRRLSVIDLTSAGHQPMISACGRFTVTYNGEIYNFEDIRQELAASGVRFRGHSDTEVIVESCARFGVEATLRRLNGMFALGIWDKAERQLYLARDPLGEKPLYWIESGPLVLFGSELKALRAVPGWEPQIDRGAVSAFLRLSYVPAPYTIYAGVQKLLPGSLLIVDCSGAPRSRTYWDVASVVEGGVRTQHPEDEDAAVEELDNLLSDAVSRRMISDVPLGAFLSGGYDSSTIVALMQKTATRTARTFTVRFEDAAFDESIHAEAVARHLGTEHTTFDVTGDDALSLVPKLPDMYDEPFADSSQIPTHIVSALTRRHVTVALSGDGGDELFTGYNRYQWAERIWESFSSSPALVRRSAH
jgi:asparagine synthase (glutamine-hydrolysing)